MKKSSLLRILPLLALGAALATPGFADIRETAREVSKSKGEAVAILEIVHSVRMSYGGETQESEEKSETRAVIVDGSGLAVAPLSSVDPAQFYERLDPQRSQEMDISTRIKEAKLILNDNTEVPAMVVLRDADLDIALLRPITKPTEPMVHVSLEGGSDSQLLSEAFVIGRGGRIVKRTIMAMTGEIQGIVEKPRKFYIPGGQLSTAGTGAPVFGEDGNLIGIILLHVLPGAASSSDGNDERVIPVVIPSSDILEVAKQAPEKGEEPPAEEAAPAAPAEDAPAEAAPES